MAEPSAKNWELTAYEFQRKPQDVCDVNAESAVTSRSLHKELMCPICLEILKKTMTTKECLHRFCADCIITALRSGNKECPTCRTKLVSKRSLRPDVNFDLLISKIYPNLDEYEAQHDRTIAKLNTTYMQTLAENIKATDGNNQQQSSRWQNIENESGKRTRKRRKYFSMSEHLSNLQPGNDHEPNSDMVVLNINENNELPSVSDEVEIILKPHPTINESITNHQSRFIKTAASATVNHLRKYLAMRINFDWDLNSSTKPNNKFYLTMNNIRIYIAKSPNHFVTLNGTETLQELENILGKSNQALDVYYSLMDVIKPPQSL